MASPTAIAGYLALFTVVGLGFIFVNLLAGRLCRPHSPNKEKLEVYECGEPTIGSSFVQFDLRFYVVALLFIIFDVEVAFFFPWATVFGKATNLMDPNLPTVVASADPGQAATLTPEAIALYQELGVRNPTNRELTPLTPAAPITEKSTPKTAAASPGKAASSTPAANEPALAPAVLQGREAVAGTAKRLAWLSICDIAVFFAVLLVGFAYVWKRGDLDWVRAVSRDRAAQSGGARSAAEQERLVST